jgi:hypothetical protein
MFSQSTIENLGYYVYALFDPEDEKWPFYIGKGRGNRVFNHVSATGIKISLDEPMSLKEEKINSIAASGKNVIHKIIRYGMSEQEALKVEASLIDLVNHIDPDRLKNLVSGQGVAEGIFETEELKLSLDAEPLETHHPIVIVKIERQWKILLDKRGSANAISHSDIFAAARGNWRVSRSRVSRAECVLIVAKGIVRDVVVPIDWEDVESGRRRMTGEKSSHNYKHMISKSVAHLFSAGSQSPLKYLNC